MQRAFFTQSVSKTTPEAGFVRVLNLQVHGIHLPWNRESGQHLHGQKGQPGSEIMTDDSSKPQPDPESDPPKKPRPKPKPKARAPVNPKAAKGKPKPKPKPKPKAAQPETEPAAAPVAKSPADPVAAATPAAANVAGAAASTHPVDAAALDADVAGEASRGSYLLFTALPSWLTSTIIHVIVLLALALLTLPPITRPKRDNELVLGENDDTTETIEQFQDQAIDSVEISDSGEVADMIVDNELITEEPLITDAFDISAAAVKLDLDPLGSITANSGSVESDIGATAGDALSGRGKAAKARMIREAGGTAGSEKAVQGALQWFANHQMADGGWDIKHKRHPKCRGQCSDEGNLVNARLGATGLALLPFLGAGKTHLEGPDSEIVNAGLQFLLRNIKYQGSRGALTDDGNYYSHGVCAIVLCEAYALTKDKTLRKPAQALINETCFAQDPIGGGWRYSRHQPGDTSAVGWQLMALKSAHMGYLDVPSQTVINTSRFLDSVQQENGAYYGYTEPGKNRRSGLTAVGLLCRMYLGWEEDHPALLKGVDFLARRGPDVGVATDESGRKDMYYNYYATQVLRHVGGPQWEEWNGKMRDFLVNSQEKEGHRAGSWSFKTGHSAEKGGRLFSTSMATMILEVYYRHLPLYQKQASEEEFQL